MKLWWYKATDGVAKARVRFQRVIPKPGDSSEERWLKIIILGGVGTIILTITLGVLAFFLVLEGAEQTVVPDVRGRELTEALLVLQDRALFPKLQLRFSSDPTLKGKVIDQRPIAGTVVKAGKRITLSVSKGAVIDTVDDFRGKKLEEVRAHLQTIFASQKPLLIIREPVTFVFHPSPIGTILEQKPEPGAALTGPTDLVLVASRGPEVVRARTPRLIGLEFDKALALLVAENIPFVFQVGQPPAGVRPGFVFEQNPTAETEIDPGAVVELTLAEPTISTTETQFGVFDYTLPTYPVMVDLKVESVSPGGERLTLFTMKHPGGRIAFPYLQPINSTLVLSIFDLEIIRHLVQP